jgi:EmrB/QacA subfamily drug resistance transporter
VQPRKETDVSTSEATQPDPRRWRALAVLGLIQFMLVVDVSIVNVALPRIQHDLGFSHAGLAWVVDGYVLMAGGLLLLGGRLADLFGRRRLFLIGVGLFALASATSGAAASPTMLVSSRFMQGAGEALAAPAALGLVVVLFTDQRERIKALGIWGGLAGLGGTTGAVISGLLTGLASWRWIFYINIPVALVALALVPGLVSESRMIREHRRRLDFGGAVTATGGLIALVYGLLEAARHPWGSSQVLVPLLGGVTLLLAMVVIEARSDAPLIPLRFFANRTRAVANFVSLFSSAAFFSYVFLMTLFEQQVLHYSPVQGGLGYLPLGLGIGAGMGIGTALMPRLGVRPLISLSFLGGAAGLLITSQIQVGSSYIGGVLPGMVVIAVSFGLGFAPIMNAALHRVTGQDSSLASGLQGSVQQIGGALGLAGVVTLALRHAVSQVRHGVLPSVAAAHSYALAFRIGALLLVVASVIVLALLERVSTEMRNPLAEAAPEPVAQPGEALVSPANV